MFSFCHCMLEACKLVFYKMITVKKLSESQKRYLCVVLGLLSTMRWTWGLDSRGGIVCFKVNVFGCQVNKGWAYNGYILVNLIEISIQTPLWVVYVRGFLERLDWGEKTHLEWRSHHPMDWNCKPNKKGKSSWRVTSPPPPPNVMWPPAFPCLDGPYPQNKLFLAQGAFAGYFFITVRKVTNSIIAAAVPIITSWNALIPSLPTKSLEFGILARDPPWPISSLLTRYCSHYKFIN